MTLSNREMEGNPTEAQQRGNQRAPKRLKRKLGKDTTYEDLLEGWTQCCFLLPVKLRLCNVGRTPGSNYCGNHIDAGKVQSGEAVDSAELRIPCPLDPTHTVYRRNLEAHLKVCNFARYNEELKVLPYYQENCNCAAGEEVATDAEEKAKVDLEQLLHKLHRMFEQVRLKEMSSEPTKTHAMDKLIEEIVGRDHTSFKHTRHVEQDIAIVHKLIEFDLLHPSVGDSNNTTSPEREDIFMEFGAGKGLLGLATHVADPKSFLVLVERSGNRRKVDKCLTERGGNFFRARMDIRHCLNPRLPCLENIQGDKSNSTVTVIAKHLCGVASDFAIRSLSHFHTSSTSHKRGLGIATCCHHACNYHNYTGKTWLSGFDISPSEFDILKSWTGWASLDRTADLRKPRHTTTEGESNALPETNEKDEQPEHELPVNNDVFRPSSVCYEDMHVIGKKVKRVLDYGRVLYLQQELHMNAELVQYCSPVLSPECFMIVAYENK